MSAAIRTENQSVLNVVLCFTPYSPIDSLLGQLLRVLLFLLYFYSFVIRVFYILFFTLRFRFFLTNPKNIVKVFKSI